VRLRRLVGVASAVVALTVAAGCGDAISGGIRDFRVCAKSEVDVHESQCTVNRQERTFSKPFACSARGGALHHARARITYDGKTVRSGSLGLGNTALAVWSPGVVRTLPGGRWTCEIAIGSHRRRAVITSTGPRGPWTDVAACLSQDTFHDECRRDIGRRVLHNVRSVTCNGTLYRRGSSITILVLHDGRPTKLAGDFDVPRDARFPYFFVEIRPKDLDAPGDWLPRGSYFCYFSPSDSGPAGKFFYVR
jgi:hypothetical protein